MRKPILTLLFCVTGIPIHFPAAGWGSDGHAIITAKAVEALPGPLKPVFQAKVEELVRLSNVPDTEWREKFPGRNNWHYLDLDAFEPELNRIDFPRDEEKVAGMAGEKGIKVGRLPWAVQEIHNQIVSALKAGNWDSAIEYAGYLSHFVEDASQPLHATINYKGQDSGNLMYDLNWGNSHYWDRHVHHRYESGMVKRFREEFADKVDARTTAESTDPVADLFSLLADSLAHIDLVLEADHVIVKDLGITADYQSFAKKREGYYSALYAKLAPLTIKRFEKSASLLAGLWVSAWKEAGKPTPPSNMAISPLNHRRDDRAPGPSGTKSGG